jgi:glutamine amidotransferase-like uncharacterized protein
MTTVYFQNKATGKKYRVVSMDKDKGTITLKGEHAEFTEKYDKAHFKELGYELVKEEEDA